MYVSEPSCYTVCNYLTCRCSCGCVCYKHELSNAWITSRNQCLLQFNSKGIQFMIRLARQIRMVRGIFGEITLSDIWQKKVWRMNRSAKGLLIETVSILWMALVRRFAELAKLSTRQTFPLYGICLQVQSHQYIHRFKTQIHTHKTIVFMNLTNQ